MEGRGGRRREILKREWTHYSISELYVNAPVSHAEKQLLRWMDSVAYEVLNNEKNERKREAVRGFILKSLGESCQVGKNLRLIWGDSLKLYMVYFP
jgi:hypothetical protein